MQSERMEQTPDSELDMVRMLELSDQDFFFLNYDQYAIGFLRTLDNTQEQMGNVSEELESLTKKQKKKC